MAILALLALFGVGGLEAPPGDVSAASAVTVLFPDEPGFAEQAEDFVEETGPEPGPSLAGEFDREPIARFRSSNGLSGTLFKEALLLPTLFLGKVDYVIYGTIAIPEGATLRGQAFSGNYGISVYDVPLVIVLVGCGTGELAAFIATSAAMPVLPRASAARRNSFTSFPNSRTRRSPV